MLVTASHTHHRIRTKSPLLACETLCCVSGEVLFAIVAYYPPCYQQACCMCWAAQCNTWLLITLTLKGIVFFFFLHHMCFSVQCMWVQAAQLASCVLSPVEGCSAYGPWQGVLEQPQAWAWPSCTWQSCCPATSSMLPLLLQHRSAFAVCTIPAFLSPRF